MSAENNRIIAKFMGYEIQENPAERFFGWYKHPLGTWSKEIDLAFHDDWNLLMSVVQKINEFLHNSMESRSEAKEVLDSLRNLNRQNTYDSCVNFIKWYNKQLNQNDNRNIRKNQLG